jgi:hypothetical protein
MSISKPDSGSLIQCGFALLELATVLFLISLLMGGMLLGNDVINSGHISGLARDFQNTSRMIYTYQDKYRALPGDDLTAEVHLSSNAIPGNGNGVIDGSWHDASGSSEASRIWQHFRLAGLMEGGTDITAPDYPSSNSLGKPMGLQMGNSDPQKSPIKNIYGTALPGSVVICSRGIPGKLVLRLDIKLDDGNPAMGSMLATPDTGISYSLGAAPTTLATQTLSDLQPDPFYIVCLGV